MYKVTLGNKTLYYPGDAEYQIYETNLSLTIGEASEFSFKVPPTNPLASEITQGSVILVLRDDEEIFRGEVREINVDMFKCLDVYCIEDLAWLADEYLWVLQYTDRTYAQMFQMWMNEYNRRTGARQFEIGMITNVNPSNVCLWQTTYDMSVLDAFRALIAKDNGYVRIRRVTENGNTTRYVDIVRLEDYSGIALQPITFGDNLLEFVKTMDMTNLTNMIYAFGAELDSEVYEGLNRRLEGPQLQNAQSIQHFGRHAKTVTFETDNSSTLDALARTYLSRYSQPQLTFELSAIDLADLSEPTEHWNIGDYVRVIAEPFGIDQDVYITQMDIDLQDISKNEIKLSSYVHTKQTLTSQTIDTAEVVNNMPSKSSILEAAKKNAFQILQGTDGGYVRFVVNDEVIEKIQILNASTEDASTKKWEWGLGGLGFFEREQPSDDWTNLGLALTMDGEIVAEKITAGTMTGQTIQGATIQTLADGIIESERSDHSKVGISGGLLTITNTDDSFLELKKYGNSARITLGADTWSFRNSSGSTYQEFDVWDDIYKLIKYWHDFGGWPHD